MNINNVQYSGNWKPSPPDSRDYTIYHEKVSNFFRDIGVHYLIQNSEQLPSYIDNRFYCSNVKDQGIFNACSIYAVGAAFEYMENKTFHYSEDVSIAYIYKKARMLEGIVGDNGAFIRDTMKVIADNGAPYNSCWELNYFNYDDNPNLHHDCDIQANQRKIVNYVRLDDGSDSQTVLNNIKANIAVGQPVVFGIQTFVSFYGTIPIIGDIYYPCSLDIPTGWHAMCIVGYDNNRIITNPTCLDDESTTGAFLVKNSFGSLWANKGYCWIPYEFLLNGKMLDIWTITTITDSYHNSCEDRTCNKILGPGIDECSDIGSVCVPTNDPISYITLGAVIGLTISTILIGHHIHKKIKKHRHRKTITK